MSDTIGYVIATRNRASGLLAIDWDMDIHDWNGATTGRPRIGREGRHPAPDDGGGHR